MKVIGALKRSRKMRKYANHAGLNKRMPNFEVKLGYGLHLGWAIEGALGSFYKIDTSYLSTHVKMSEKLEESTKMYQTMLLISGPLYDQLTDACQQECRQIDNLIFAGQSKPTALYTCDVNITKFELEPVQPKLNKKQARAARVKARMSRD